MRSLDFEQYRDCLFCGKEEAVLRIFNSESTEYFIECAACKYSTTFSDTIFEAEMNWLTQHPRYLQKIIRELRIKLSEVNTKNDVYCGKIYKLNEKITQLESNGSKLMVSLEMCPEIQEEFNRVDLIINYLIAENSALKQKILSKNTSDELKENF